jgi:hypothetical protein
MINVLDILTSFLLRWWINIQVLIEDSRVLIERIDGKLVENSIVNSFSFYIDRGKRSLLKFYFNLK